MLLMEPFDLPCEFCGFFCSGQSNMVFPLKLTLNATDEIATLHKYPNFRFFMTQRDSSPVPLWNLRSSNDSGSCDAKSTADGCNRWWTAEQALANGLIDDFSAVCYMTVRDVARLHTGTRPVALVQSAWGGTRGGGGLGAAGIIKILIKISK